MRHATIGSLVLGLCILAPVTAAAQRRVPHTESSSVGVDAGAFVPSGDRLENGPVVTGFFEYYLTPRVSVRPSIGWSSSDFNGSGVDSVRQVPLRVDLNYNWERRKWHPFVGAGLGGYMLQLRHRDQRVGDSETKLGLNVGGGAEYFFHRTVSFKGEARYHAVNEFRGVDPSGFAFTLGLKSYF